MSDVFESGTQHVEFDADAVDQALEELEDAMKAGEYSLNHGEVRPSTVNMAHRARDAYRTLVEAHPDYELTGEDE